MERIKHARRLIRAASVRAAGNAGTGPLLMFHMPNTNDYLNPTNTVRFQEKNKNKKQTSNKRATSRQTNEQAPSATNHEQRTSKQNPPLKVHGQWTPEKVSSTPDYGAWLR